MRNEKTVTMKKVQYGFLLTAVLMLLMLVTQLPVQAATKKPTCVKKKTIYYTQDDWYSTKTMLDTYSTRIYIKNAASNASITNVKTSNKNFAAEKSWEKGTKYVGVGMWRPVLADGTYRTIKSGTKVTVKFTVKQNGKKYKLKTVVTFKKRLTPFKTVKIGNTNYASSFSGHKVKENMNFSGKQKISVKMKPGYKLRHITVYYNNVPEGKKVKNNTTISMDNVSAIYVEYKHTKNPKNCKKFESSTMKSYFMNETAILSAGDH